MNDVTFRFEDRETALRETVALKFQGEYREAIVKFRYWHRQARKEPGVFLSSKIMKKSENPVKNAIPGHFLVILCDFWPFFGSMGALVLRSMRARGLKPFHFAGSAGQATASSINLSFLRTRRG